ncbi:probable calcium-binding protein CML24 [Triticum dicoccoides]|nr:probable calcium-binding protein CML24 [Triticum dicoccoides]XP_044452725.1 probable calcium-binding protein CML24 [Triticum aestivum]
MDFPAEKKEGTKPSQPSASAGDTTRPRSSFHPPSYKAARVSARSSSPHRPKISKAMAGEHQQSQGAAKALSKGSPSPSFRLRNGSLNAVRLRRVFDMFDRNGDGEITVDELAQALDALGLEADRASLAATVGAHVPPGASGLRFEDFEGLHRALGDALFGALADDAEEGGAGGQDEEEMREAFKVFDVDGDGFISASELQEVLKKLGMPEASSLANVREMICNVDRDSDGRVDFGEFKIMMQGINV